MASHDNEDELFLVVKGRFRMEFRERHTWVEEGEFLIVPRGVEHRPVADEEVHVLLFEPASTLNTGSDAPRMKGMPRVHLISGRIRFSSKTHQVRFADGRSFGSFRAQRFAEIVLAVKCHDGDPLIRLGLECRILGRQPPELIAEHLEVPIFMVDAYKLYFFDIDDRIDATSYIAHQVIRLPPCGLAPPMKHFVFRHGAAAIEPWLDYLQHQHEIHDLKTFAGWQRDSIGIFLRAQELPYADAKLFVKCLPFIMGICKPNRVFRSASSVFQEKAFEILSRLNWPEPAAEKSKSAAPSATTRSERRTMKSSFSKAS